ncbi:MAG: hypothetical protein Kow0032_08570 [Methyloligellaceae bacterium]
MLDKILVLISLAALTAFCGVIVAYVGEPDLVITVGLILALAMHDFWISVFSKNGVTELAPAGALESQPTGVSGKPIDEPYPAPAAAQAEAAPKQRKPARKASKAKGKSGSAAAPKTAAKAKGKKTSTRARTAGTKKKK